MTRYLQPTVGLLALLLAVLTVGTFMGHDAAGGQEQFFQPCATVEVVDTAPGASSDINTKFGVGIGDNCILEPSTDNEAMYNFGGVVGFTPTAFEIVDVPTGTEMGSLTAQSTLGLLNNGCDTSLAVSFKFYDGTTDQATKIDPLPPGTADRMKPLGEGTPPAGATAWPSYLNELFPNADWSKLKARYLGNATVPQANNLTVILNFLLFEPGARITDPENIDPIQGRPSVTVLQDPTAPAAPADLINDFCSPLLSQTVIAAAVRKNPPTAGTYPFFTWAVSQRDADNDGFENGLDTCNANANVGDPRKNPDPGDPDRDGLDDACDPAPSGGSGTCAYNLANTDEDNDTWCNRSDNCPLNANTDQADDDSDALGNACDPDPATATGGQIPRCLVTAVQIGGGGTQTHDPLQYRPCNPQAQLSTVVPGATPPPEAAAGAGGGATGGGTTGGSTTGGSTTGGSTTGGVGGTGPASGIGSLSPVDTTVPMWAAMMVAFGLVGLLGGASFVRAWAKSRR